jgi:hypothetical protein
VAQAISQLANRHSLEHFSAALNRQAVDVDPRAAHSLITAWHLIQPVRPCAA